MSETLKPCPFCGGEMEVTDDGAEDAPVPWTIRHVEPMGGRCPWVDITFYTAADARESWNRRALPAETSVHRALALVERALEGREGYESIQRQTGGTAPELVQGILDGIGKLYGESPEPVAWQPMTYRPFSRSPLDLDPYVSAAFIGLLAIFALLALFLVALRLGAI